MAIMEINNELIRSLGMALVHSLWEGLVILVLILFFLSLAGRSNARLRYWLLVSGQFLLLTAFIATWYITYHHNMAMAIKPFTRVYSHVDGLVSAASIAITTAGYTATLNQFLEPLYPALAVGWTMGFIFMVIRMAGGFYLSYNILRKDVFLPGPSMMDLFESAKSRMKITARLNLRMSTRQLSPMVIGIIKPCVIVPASILSGLNTEQVEAILVHELAHIRRYDHVVMIMQAFITQILFFHPVAWYLSSEISRERENCCDDLVIKAFPNPINYIKALTMIQELNVDGQVPANALMGRSKRLLGRVKRLLKTEKKHVPVFRITTIFLLLVMLGVATITIVSAGNSETRKSFEKFFKVKPEKLILAADTIKTKKHEKTAVNTGIQDAEDSKKQKEMDEAARNLEKAQLELQKAQMELQRAREDFMRAGGQMRSHDLAGLSEEHAKRFMSEDDMREFKLQHEKEFDEQRRAMELQRREMAEHMRLSQDVMRERMRQFKPEEWEQHMKEWENASRELNEKGKEFYKARKDSNDMYMKRRHSYMEDYPEAPMPPPMPPADIDAPDMPDIESPVAPESPDIENLDQPEPVAPSELLNNDEGREDKDNSAPLDTKLMELEKE
jgi:beta-lactamase regulating signal transducer with metallopeptidase domain